MEIVADDCNVYPPYYNYIISSTWAPSIQIFWLQQLIICYKTYR